ncbi:hypothetical protein LQG66_31055 [Bradyrhizobium ontarionense]|uniref:Uncharacterized protein n=1 Tax=Bradyrhizobium ontarionense TaxID=2898149 RepID=A0ABY3R8E1_9BRAD|nr:hypothetical protein [Bradyrhizobium sp. A19]UFZ03610.1 hypothetical protein LQG66_31055 [Bradyrhizobium sp. A19]
MQAVLSASPSAPKSPFVNLVEGMALTALFQAIPTYAAAALILKVAHSTALRPGIVGFVGIATVLHVLLVTSVGPRYPHFARQAYAAEFYDATLGLADKVLRWRMQPLASLQLLGSTVMLSLLSIAALATG